MLRSQELFIFIVPLPGDTVPVPNDNDNSKANLGDKHCSKN